LERRSVEALKENGLRPSTCATLRRAAEKILALIPEGGVRRLGGSWTVMSLGIQEKLAEGEHVLFDHNAPGLSNEERQEMRRNSSPATCSFREPTL